MTKEKLREIRGKRNRQQMSIFLHIPARTIKAYETGENPIPTWLPKYIEALQKVEACKLILRDQLLT